MCSNIVLSNKNSSISFPSNGAFETIKFLNLDENITFKLSEDRFLSIKAGCSSDLDGYIYEMFIFWEFNSVYEVEDVYI